MNQEKMKQLSLKKVSLVAILAMISLASALAQDQQDQDRPERPRNEFRGKGPEGQKPAKRLEAQDIALFKAKECQRELQLDDKKTEKIFKLYKKELENMEAAMQKDGANRDQLAKEMNGRIEKKMQNLLTDVQFAQWQQMEKRQRHCQHKGKGHGAGGPQGQGAPHGDKPHDCKAQEHGHCPGHFQQGAPKGAQQ